MDQLFIDSNGKSYDKNDVLKVLSSIGAGDCNTIFIHSDVTFGKPAQGFKRSVYLNTLWEILCEIAGNNVQIIAPTFTYSFCNNEDYNVKTSRTSMGALNEFIRKLDGRYRTLDPLLSLSVPEELKNKFEKIGENSLGEKSGLDTVHNMDGVKFLFFGADMASCFTYLHYIEKMLDVPYRFDMKFDGNIIDEEDNVIMREQYIHTQCYGVKLPERYGYFEEYLIDKGLLIKKRLGDNYISCISEKDAYREITNKIHNDINYFLERPFKNEDLIHKYVYDLNKGRITHC